VSEQIRRELAELIRTELKDPRVGMVSITDVEVTPTMRMPRSFSAAWPGANICRGLTGLQKASGFLRRELGRASASTDAATALRFRRHLARTRGRSFEADPGSRRDFQGLDASDGSAEA
jgi:ribosome-binding factor A